MKYIKKYQNGTTISGPVIKGRQFPKGTIITNDPDTYKANQDSLKLYKKGLENIRIANNPSGNRIGFWQHPDLGLYERGNGVTSFEEWDGNINQAKPAIISEVGEVDNVSRRILNAKNKPIRIAVGSGDSEGYYGLPVYKKPAEMVYEPFINKMQLKGLPVSELPVPQMKNMPDRIEMDSRKGAEYKGINVSHYTDGLGRYTAKLNLSTTPGIRGRISYKDGGILKFQKGTPYTPKEFTEAYINSPNYLKRLEQSGYELPVVEQNNRLGRVKEVTTYQQKAAPKLLQKATNIAKGIPYSTTGSTATPLNAKYPSIVIDQKQSKRLGESMPKIAVHTMSHHETGLKNGEFLNDYDKKQLIDRSHSSCNCEVEPHENKADLNAIRYELFNKKVDVLNGEITPKNLKLLDRKSLINKRMSKSYKEEDLLWLLNNIASNNTNSTNQG